MVGVIPPVTICKSGLDMGHLDAWQRTSKAFLALWWRVAGASVPNLVYLRHGFSLPETKSFAPKDGGAGFATGNFILHLFLIIHLSGAN